MLSKMLLTAAALAWGAYSASARSLSDTYSSMCDSLHVTGMDMPASTIGSGSEKVKSLNMAMLPSEELATAQSMLGSIPAQNLWLEVRESDTEVNIYGEEAGEECNLLMFVNSPAEGSLLFYIEGDKALLNEINL